MLVTSLYFKSISYMTYYILLPYIYSIRAQKQHKGLDWMARFGTRSIQKKSSICMVCIMTLRRKKTWRVCLSSCDLGRCIVANFV